MTLYKIPTWQFWDYGGVKLESLCNYFSIVGCQWTVNCLLGSNVQWGVWGYYPRENFGNFCVESSLEYPQNYNPPLSAGKNYNPLPGIPDPLPVISDHSLKVQYQRKMTTLGVLKGYAFFSIVVSVWQYLRDDIKVWRYCPVKIVNSLQKKYLAST